MTVGIAALRAHLAGADVDGARGYSRRAPVPEYPCFVVGPPLTLPYHRTHGRRLKVDLVVTVYASMAVSVAAGEDDLDRLMSYDGVPAALEATSTAELTVVAKTGTNFREFSLVDDDGAPVADLLAGDIAVEITYKETPS